MQVTTKTWLKRALVGGVLAVVLGAGLTVYLLQREPAVWRAAEALREQRTDAERVALAESVIARLSEAAEASADVPDVSDVSAFVKPEAVQRKRAILAEAQDAEEAYALKQLLANTAVDETYALTMGNDELIAMASGMVDDWLNQRGFQMPESMDKPVVMVDRGKLVIAFEIEVGSWRQVFTGAVGLTFQPDGMAKGRVEKLTAGSLPMPATSVGSWLARQLPRSQAKTAEKIGNWIAQLEGFEFRPVLELEHRRRARIVAMDLAQQSLTLTMRLQDHETYKRHNALMKTGSVAVNDKLPLPGLGDGAVADVPTTTE
ncbi:MAG: hypothetical protein ACPGYV_08075 [Phycisphaeraceae bacterium]